MIKFYCKKCGKEMWELVNFDNIKHLTLEQTERSLICSDCILKEIKEDVDSVNLIDTDNYE